MTESILVALITGGLSLVGVIITSRVTAQKQERTAAINQAVMDTKIDELTREVREHNNFAVKIPAYEQRIRELERRVGTLEQYHMNPN